MRVFRCYVDGEEILLEEERGGRKETKGPEEKVEDGVIFVVVHTILKHRLMDRIVNILVSLIQNILYVIVL